MYKKQLFSIPTKPAAFNDYQASFTVHCTQHATDWNLPAEVVSQLQQKSVEWRGAYELTANSQTDSLANRAGRDAVMDTFSMFIDNILHKFIIGNDQVGEAELAALGVHDQTLTRTPAPAITTIPSLTLDNTEHGAIHVQFQDSGNPGTKAKPEAAAYLELRYQVDGTAPATADDARGHATTTRFGQRVSFQEADREKRVYFFGRWVDAKGNSGKWSAMVSALII